MITRTSHAARHDPRVGLPAATTASTVDVAADVNADVDRRSGTAPGRRRTVIGALVGAAALVGVWAVLANQQPELVLPSPSETVSAAIELGRDGTLLAELVTTVIRAAIAVSIAIAVGVVWGMVNGLSAWSAAISRAGLAGLMAVPPVVLVIVGLTWFGPGAATTRLVVILVAIPLIVIAVEEAVRNIDRDLLEMAAAFGFGRATTLRHVIGPAIASPVLAATSVALGQSLRVAVMAELLSASTGVGAEIARARANLETADVFAWALVLVIFVLVVELAVLAPITKRLLRWRTTP